MKINNSNESNIRALNYLSKRTYNERNKNTSPLNYDQANWDLTCLPEIALILWNDFTKELPVSCAWVLFGTPVLIRPDTGIIFGIAAGTNPPLLRFSQHDKDVILKSGGRQQLINLDGVYADAMDIGPEWVYCFSFNKSIEHSCYKSYTSAI